MASRKTDEPMVVTDQSVTATPDGAVVTFNGQAFGLDVQTLLAVRRGLDSVAVSHVH